MSRLPTIAEISYYIKTFFKYYVQLDELLDFWKFKLVSDSKS